MVAMDVLSFAEAGRSDLLLYLRAEIFVWFFVLVSQPRATQLSAAVGSFTVDDICGVDSAHQCVVSVFDFS